MTVAGVNLFGLPRGELAELFSEHLGRPYRAKQLMKWVYHHGNTDIDAMTDLAKAHRAWLIDHTTLHLPKVVQRWQSVDGTVKWALEVSDGNLVEMVLIPDRGRNTLCVSSQIGCMLDCAFCATGKQGFNGNLSAADIVGQVWLCDQFLRQRGEQVSNVVLMGMGEPLLNLDAVLKATQLMMDDLAFGISKRRVTVSTAGVVPAIYELADHTDVSLAVSLHAPSDALRDRLVPINRKYPIAALLDACKHYLDRLGDRRSLTMEYTLLKGVNDSLADARALAKLLADLRCKINLIPFNPFPGAGFEAPQADDVRRFQTYLMNAGYATMLRTTRGADIDAACGQLVGRVQDRTRRQERYLARLRG